MQPKRLHWWFFGIFAFFLPVAFGGTPSDQKEKPPGPAAKTQHYTAPKDARATKRAAVPLQASLALATASNNEFHNPPLWDCSIEKGPVDLRLSKGRFLFPGASLQSQADQPIPQNFELLCYENKLNQLNQAVGPTIRVKPGTTFKIHLMNNLRGVVDPGPAAGNPLTSESPHGFCSTNLHTHGLHVSPAANADNVFRILEPGDDFTFTYDIRDDHPSGTFWYHPHKHGSVAYQMANGLAGAIIVERPYVPGGPIRYLEDIEAIHKAKALVMVLQLYNYRVGYGDARIDASTIYNVTSPSKSCEEINVTGSAPGAQATAINGQIVPTIRMKPGEVQRWRIIDATWDEIKPLAFEEADNADPTKTKTKRSNNLVFREIAIDGLATGLMHETSSVELAPGQRSDVLIKAPKLKVAGMSETYFLKQDAVSVSKSLRGRASDPLYLAKIIVEGNLEDMDLPSKDDLAKCKAFPTDIPAPPPPGAPTELKDGVLLNGVDKNQTYNINYMTFHNQHDIQIARDSIQEWVIKAAPAFTDNSNPDANTNQYANNHPFHIHVNPFQVISHTDAQGKITKMNCWRDTLLVHGGESYTIRMQFKDYTGRTVFHCHILDHEDQGMMVPINIYDPAIGPPPGAGAPRLALQAASDKAPAMKLPDLTGLEHSLDEFQGCPTILVFFQGIECRHCAETLRELLSAVRNAAGVQINVVAVSSRTIADLSRATEMLGLLSTDRFHLLIDRDFKAFRDFRCFDGIPMHGLFVLDGTAVVRAKYIGQTPFDDSESPIRLVKTLNGIGKDRGQ
jgi:FtsP/CotA-like multicopper oxidase with cupredoxin domain/peroxiredoxin